jgi:hypothetical protein
MFPGYQHHSIAGENIGRQLGLLAFKMIRI